jgi:3-carboxy-cis,cis-muconate cycloisomerase
VDASERALWLDPLLTTSSMRRVFSDQGRLQGLLDFEAALARAQARAEVIPAGAARAIEAQCRCELFDIGELARGSAAAGNSAIPVVDKLTELVEQSDPAAARFVHFGATSQDAMDTGLVLQLRQALDLIATDLANLSADLARLAAAHKHTLQSGRTWLQQASPITFGLKVAGWLSACLRHRQRLCELRPRALALQLGGATGTLAALGDHGLRIASLLAADLKLTLPDLPWHAHRDRFAETAAALGLLAGTLGKMARDISLLSQSEIGEAAEPAAAGRGSSSSMPHKQNPIACGVALAAALRVPALVSTMLAAMVQEHERGLGGWQAEWETLPEICTLVAGALAQMQHVAQGLTVDPGRMAENLDRALGLERSEALALALARHIGRRQAQAIVAAACRQAVEQGRQLREVIAAYDNVRSHLTADELQRACDAQTDHRAAAALVGRVLAEHARQNHSP